MGFIGRAFTVRARWGFLVEPLPLSEMKFPSGVVTLRAGWDVLSESLPLERFIEQVTQLPVGNGWVWW